MTRTNKKVAQRDHSTIVELFLERAKELVQTNLAKSGLSIRHNIHYEKDSGLSTEFEEPNENDLRSYLLTFRQFISEGEPIFIGRIYNLCARCLTDDELKRDAADARQYWHLAQRHNGMKLIVNGREYTASEVCDWFINGQYFHNDPEHRAKIKEMERFPLDREIFRFHFLNFVIEASRHAMYLRNLIAHAQREGKIEFVNAEKQD